jgi:phospholipid/cholesterol/gamma-HCH transport system substrate-binding protein
MENRSNRYLVGSVVAALLLALIGYISWASPSVGKRSRPYDIFFEKSVAGLAENSPVSLEGVTVGRVTRIRFDPSNPELVRVRIQVTNPDAPILVGTTALIDRDLFGIALIRLDAGSAGSPPLLASRWDKVALIPAKEGGLTLEDPVSVVENISNTADRLNKFLTPDNQRTISDEIARLERRSAALAARAPELADTIARTRSSLRSGAAMAEAMDAQVAAMDKRLQSRRGSTEALRASLRSTRESMAQFDASVQAFRPKIAKLSDSELQEQVSAMRESADELGRAVQAVDRAGVGSLMSKPALPDHNPGQ